MPTRNCFFVENMLSAYLDGELDYENREAVLEHLRNCGRCRVKKEVILSAIGIVRDTRIPLKSTTIDTWLDELRGKLSKRREPIHHLEYRFFRGWRRWIVAAAAVCVAGMVMVRIGIEFEKRSVRTRNVFEALIPHEPVTLQPTVAASLGVQVSNLDSFVARLKDFFETVPFPFVQQEKTLETVEHGARRLELERELYPLLGRYLNSTGSTPSGPSAEEVAKNPSPVFYLVIEEQKASEPEQAK